VNAVLLDFILGEAHPSGWELTRQAGFVAPTRNSSECPPKRQPSSRNSDVLQSGVRIPVSVSLRK